MRKHLSLIFILMLVVLSLCCCNSSSKDKDSSKSKKNSADSSTPKPVEKTEDEKLYDSLFNDDTFVSIKIDIPEEELAKIEKDFKKYSAMHSKSPIYRKATKVTFTVGDKDYVLEDVGVRMKGNTSRTSFYTQDNGVSRIVHLKLSFDETFDDTKYYTDDAVKWTDKAKRDERKKRTFATLSGVDLKWNRGYDNTYIRENYCYKMFRDFGVYAPQISPVALSVNDKSWGVLNLYEPVDKTFIERNVEKAECGGDLYKGAWTQAPAAYLPDSTFGINDSDAPIEYNFDLKTNKKTSKHEAMQNLLKVVNDSSLDKKSFDSVVDVNEWLMFAAVGYFAGSPDNLKNNYNNHYVYFNKGNKKAVFIPYDYDTAFGCCTDWDPSHSAMTEIDPFSTTTIVSGQEQLNPIYIYSIFKDKGFYYKEYCDALKKVAESKWLKFETFKELYDKTEKLYGKYVETDVKFSNQTKSLLPFKLDSDYSKGGNMPLDEYMEKILANYEKCLKAQ